MKNKIRIIILSGIVASCSNSNNSKSSSTGTDISNITLTSTATSCSSYEGTYFSSVTDVNNSTTFSGSLSITDNGTTCSFETNSIPNHNFNDGGQSFANDVGQVNVSFTVTSSPVNKGSDTAISLSYDNGILLNGSKVDILAAACYGVGTDPLGSEKIGCNTDGTPWRYDPMYSGNSFGTDSHNAHAQPDGAYHYHGNPNALFDSTGTVASPIIGFAADGFPIYGPYINDGSSVRAVVSGWALKSGARTNQAGEGAFPGGNYDGTFRDDYEFTNAGDLDNCNGMTYNGSYAYFVSNTFPWMVNCFKGTINNSFSKQ